MGQGGVRLLTLSGPAGVGKTRLALEVASLCRDQFRDGAVFIPLSSLSDPTLLDDTLARGVGVRIGGGALPRDALIAHLHQRQILLVLDNFEHLLPAVGLLADLLSHGPGLALMVTSRAILRLRGERILPVPPLPVPEATDSDWTHVAANPTVALLMARAKAVRPDLAMTADNASQVAAICRQLDGLPLALELAAPRLRLLSPGALLARLERRLTTLTGGPRDLPERHQTLRAALAWSYNLLPAPNRRSSDTSVSLSAASR